MATKEPVNPEAPTGGAENIIEPTGTSLTLYAKPGEVQAGAAQSVMVNGIAYRIARRVNLPILKHEDGETIAVRIDMPINEEATTRDITVRNPETGQPMAVTQEGVINVVRVTEIYCGEPFNLVLSVMAAGDLRDAYPEHSYVGRTFAIQKVGLVQGKRYKQVNVVEIEPMD